MKRIIQAVVVASLFAGAHGALAWPADGEESNLLQPQSTYADRYAGEKAVPPMEFPASGEDSNSVTVQSTYADRYAGEPARAAMVFPASGDDVITGTQTRTDHLAAGAADPALSQ